MLNKINGSFLKLEGVNKYYGGFRALKDVSISVGQGEVRAIIGPNGAGKSTLLKVISGEIKGESGKIYYKEKEITSLSAQQIRKCRLSRSFQKTEIMLNMAVVDNIKLAVQSFTPFRYSLMNDFENNPLLNQKANELLDALDFMSLKDITAGLLSYADQRKVDLALALAGEPEILLLDEPTSGMSFEESQKFCALMLSLCKKDGITMVFVEHDMDVVFKIAQKITVLSRGSVLMEGEPHEVLNNSEVQKIYIGEEQ